MHNMGKKSTIQYLAAGFLGFAVMLGVGSLASLIHGSSRSAKVAFSPRADSNALVSTHDGGAVRPASAAAASTSSPLPVLPAEARDGSAAAAQSQTSASAANPAAAPAATLAAAGRVDMSGSASSSASVSAAAAAAKSGAASARGAVPAANRPLPRSAQAVASMVHYGVSGRSELMGRAAGPVYNFSGGGANPGGRVAADNAAASGALKQMDAAEQQVDASSLPDDQKAQLHQQLDQARAAAPAAAAATP